MPISFRPGVRENVGLWINLIAGTGGGKTFTGMRLASGIAGDKPFAVIDTENRRALHYGDRFRFDHAELRAPFRPDAYAEAVVAADAAGYPVIMIDSGSHVWAGDGGVLDWQEDELDRMAGDDWKKREACKMAAWIKPKMAHKQMVNKLLQVKAHIILCLRAEPKIEMVRGESGKMEIRAKESLTGLNGWIPICEKNLPFEATASFLLMAGSPGIPHPIKLQEQHRAIFPPGKVIDEEAGRRLAQWAVGGAQKALPSIEMRVAACQTKAALDALWAELDNHEEAKYLNLFKARSKELKGASQPVQQPKEDEEREIADKREKSEPHGSQDGSAGTGPSISSKGGERNDSDTSKPLDSTNGANAVTGGAHPTNAAPTIADVRKLRDAGKYDEARDLARGFPAEDREHLLANIDEAEMRATA